MGNERVNFRKIFDVIILGVKANSFFADPGFDRLVDSLERPAADEEDVRGVEGYEFLVRVLSPAARGNVRDRSFQDLQKRLLDALAGNIAGNRRIIRFPPEFVELVDIDDSPL